MYKYRRVIVTVIAVFLAFLLVGGIVLNALGASSSEIKERIEALKEQEEEIAAQQKEIQGQITGKESDIMDLVSQKNRIDQQIKLTQDSIENKNELIQEYSLLIAEKQNELDDALEERDSLNDRYKLRIRSMEEKGKLTYWSILFQASSFADLLDRVDMINEIARADSRMIDQIQEVAQQIEVARQDLAAEKIEIEEAKEALAAEETALEEQRAESDSVMAELMSDRDALMAAEEKYESQKEDVLAEIAKKEVEYQEAVEAEERARREAEEKARREAEEKARREAEEAARKKAAAEAAARQKAASSGSGSSSSGSSGSSGSSSSSSSGWSVSSYGFQWPTSARYITCHFGPRYHPITGVYSNHSGMDIGADYGDPVYACASGTVTTAGYGEVYGYHVVINHGNGFSTLYGHMCRYVVSYGQYVTRGQIIGYVGSTGWSTGPHLHLTMYYYGNLVDPEKYLP